MARSDPFSLRVPLEAGSPCPLAPALDPLHRLTGIAQVLAGFPLPLALLHYLATLALVLGMVRLGGAFHPSQIGPAKAQGG